MSGIKQVVCIKSFIGKDFFFYVGRTYDYWTNFGGLNYIVDDGLGNRYPFDGEVCDDRECIWEYFVTIDDWRERQIIKIID